MEATYTVIDKHGQATSGLTLREAAVRILEYGGHVWEIRRKPGATISDLYISRFPKGHSAWDPKLIKCRISGLDDTEIFMRVLGRAEWFDDHTAVTDQAYTAMLAGRANEEA